MVAYLTGSNPIEISDLGLKVKVKFSKKWVKNQRNGHILEVISPTDLILGIKILPNKIAVARVTVWRSIIVFLYTVFPL